MSASDIVSAQISIASLTKTFNQRKAIDDLSLSVAPGEMVALIGASGSGKSTLLRHIAGLVAGDRQQGRIKVLGEVIQEQGRISRDVRRLRSKLGFVFQQFNLVGRLSVLSNVLIGHLGQISTWRGTLAWFTKAEKIRALQALHRVGMAEFAGQRASTLSGGQQQRVAIARTLVQDADIILADEPIASLDPESARRVMESLARINREDGRTVLVSLHQVDFALRYCSRAIALKDGKIFYDGASDGLDNTALQRIYGAEASSLNPDLTGLDLSARSVADDAAPPLAAVQ